VTSPYRNEIDALRERKTALEQETARLRAQREELAWLAGREAQLVQELAQVNGQLDEKLRGGKRQLPMLDRISVASPCSAKWDEMVGDDRTRFCLSCDKNVFNISALPREEAEQFLQDRVGGDVCVRFYQRADGTIMTSDCSVGVKRKRRKKALGVAGAIAFTATAIGGTMFAVKENQVMGKMQVAPQPVVYVDPAPVAPTIDPPTVAVDDSHHGQWVAGGLRALPSPPNAEDLKSKPKTPPKPKLPMPRKPIEPVDGDP
jgi:hypothetical protein